MEGDSLPLTNRRLPQTRGESLREDFVSHNFRFILLNITSLDINLNSRGYCRTNIVHSGRYDITFVGVKIP